MLYGNKICLDEILVKVAYFTSSKKFVSSHNMNLVAELLGIRWRKKFSLK